MDSVPATELWVYVLCGVPVLLGIYLYIRSARSTRDGHKVLLGYPIIGCALEMTPTNIYDTILKYALKHGPVFDMYILNRCSLYTSIYSFMR